MSTHFLIYILRTISFITFCFHYLHSEFSVIEKEKFFWFFLYSNIYLHDLNYMWDKGRKNVMQIVIKYLRYSLFRKISRINFFKFYEAPNLGVLLALQSSCIILQSPLWCAHECRFQYQIIIYQWSLCGLFELLILISCISKR